MKVPKYKSELVSNLNIGNSGHGSQNKILFRFDELVAKNAKSHTFTILGNNINEREK